MATYTSSTPLKQIDCYRKRGAKHTGIGLHLMFKPQLVATLYGNRRTQHTTAITQHKIHMLGCHQFGSHNQVALVFAVLVIYYNNELSFFEILYSFLNRSKFE